MELAVPIVADLEGLLHSDRTLGLAALDAELHAIEDARRVLAAREAKALALADTHRLHATDSHASMWGYLRADLGWSIGECRRRMRLARLVAEFPEVGERLDAGVMPVAAADEIARAHANPRCGDRLGDVIGELLTAAAAVEHDDMRTLVARWITLADTDGAHRDAEANHERRNAHVDVFAGSGSINAQLGALDGAEAIEIFDHFVDAELRTDWDAAKQLYGDDVAKSQLARTNAQRRADALMAIFRTAAAAPSDARGRPPVLNVLIDIGTLADHLVELEILPAGFTSDWRSVRLADRRCETANGVAITPNEAFQVAMAGLVRRLIVNTDGVVIEATSEQRLFRGAQRKVVMSQHPRCTHRGCRVRAGRCQADHREPHSRGGPTSLENGAIGCRRHNVDRYRRGYTTRRDSRGWHTYRADGTEIGFEPPGDPPP
jgi:hypothetical protein